MSNQLDITFNYNSDNEPEKLKAKFSFLDPELIGKEATFTIEQYVNVNDFRPVNKSNTLFSLSFTASSTPELVTIPSHVMKERPYTYNGAKIDVECFAILKVNDKWIRSDTSTQKRLPDTNLKKSKIGGSASNLIEPKDVFSFTKNLMAISARNKIATFGLMMIGLILIVINMILGIHDQMSSEHATILYSHYDSNGDSSTPLGKALVGYGAIGVAIWLAIKRQKFLTDHHPDFREHSHHWLWLKGKEQKSKTVRVHRLVVVDKVVNPLQLSKVSTLLRQNQPAGVASHLNPAWFRILGRRANACLYYTDTDQAKLASYLKRRNVDFSEKAFTAFSAQLGVNYVDLDCVLERHPDTSLDQALSLWNKLNRLAIQPVDNGQQVLPELKYSSTA
ncbi:MAG TPA: hypothetical protein DGJ56_09590 [Verrucomicrobiales bacterium]|nr:hypothetical protein [Verrucomicrobiales bacterium]